MLLSGSGSVVSTRDTVVSTALVVVWTADGVVPAVSLPKLHAARLSSTAVVGSKVLIRRIEISKR